LNPWMEVRVLLPQPVFFGSQALTVKPPALNRQNSEHYRGGPPLGSMAQQAAQLPHKEKVAGANPARAPIFSKRGRAAIAARCKRVALAGCEGASPSASTILHPTRRKRRTVLLRQRAGRTSLWMLQFLCGRGGTVDASARGADGRKSMKVRFPLSAPIYRGVVKLGNTADSKPAGRHCPCRCESGRRDQSNHVAVRGTVDRAVLKTAAPLRRVGVQVAPAAPIFR
jgi:hypothetical protein